MTPRLLTLDDAANLLGVSRSTVERLIRAGRLPVVRIGRLVRIDEADLRPFVLGAKERYGVISAGSSPAGVTVKGRLWD